MPEEEPKKPKKRARSKKTSVESTNSASRKTSDTRDKQGGGLGVVVVILVGLIILAAIVFAAQNSKTRSLEKEVDSLHDSLQQKVSELDTELEEQKQLQEELREKDGQGSQFNLAKSYSSREHNFTIKYPVTYIAEVSDLSDQNETSLLLESTVFIPETDLNKSANNRSGRRILLELYNNESALPLTEWLTTHSEAYDLGYATAQAENASTQQFNGKDFYSYQNEETSEIHYVTLVDSQVLHLAGDAGSVQNLSDVDSLLKAMIEKLEL